MKYSIYTKSDSRLMRSDITGKNHAIKITEWLKKCNPNEDYEVHRIIPNTYNILVYSTNTI